VKEKLMTASHQDLIPFDDNNQFSIVAFVHDLYEPETCNERASNKDDDNRASGTGKKKYANCYLQAESSWHFTRIWGNEKNVNRHLAFTKLKEAEEKKKAIKMVVKQGVGLSKRVDPKKAHRSCTCRRRGARVAHHGAMVKIIPFVR
jgi:hypothetical protein